MSSNSLKFVALASVYSGEKPHLFSKAINSVINQTHPVPIALVIDGPLTLDLEKKINEYSDSFEHVFRLDSQVGLGRALQFAIEKLQSTYDYVIRFDTDDENLPERFSKTINKINEEKLDLVSAHLNEFSSVNACEHIGYRRVPVGNKKILDSIHKRNPFNHPAVAFRISHALDAGGYRHMPFFEDWYLWARMIKQGAYCGNIDEVLVNFNGGISAMSRRRGARYAINEINFFFNLYCVGLPKRHFIFFMLPVRVITRLIGKRLFSIIYKVLRHSNK